MRHYAPEFCTANDMAYLIGMKPSVFKDAVENGFLPQPFKNPFSGADVWDRDEVIAAMRMHSQQKYDSKEVDLDILRAARGEKT
ncbi:hypothetical protein ACQU0X_30790 [Pseudovibrio ascidiaceicola]|uniref:hypothetical protein n=1 Tax=Pseudovibrio ascidiaceicola TaxID=285279 RepID=UPI003D36BFD8